MKNLLKKFNAFGLVLILVCGVVLTTQSAFTSRTLRTYHLVGTNWILVDKTLDPLPDGQTGDYESNSYRCELSSATCTADIDSEDAVVPDDENLEKTNIVQGAYTINPEPGQ